MPNLLEVFGAISLIAKLTIAVAVSVFGLAVSHLFRPTALKLALMRPVSLAALFATFSGLLGGWIAVLSGVAATPAGTLPTPTLYQGIAASLVTGFVCFGFLAAAWLLVAMGMLRRDRLDVAP